MIAELRRLAEICEISRVQSRPNGEDGLRYIGLEHVEAGTGAILEPADGEEPFKGAGFRFDDRHVLYGKLRPYLNKVALPEGDGRCSMELVPLLPKPGVERAYLAALLRNPRVVEHVSSRNIGARMPRADMSLLMAFEVPVPPLDEQRRIVDLLSRAAGLKRLAEEAQTKAGELIPALFLDMFGDPGTNPQGWPMVALGKVASIVSGAGFPKADQGKTGEQYPFLKVSDMNLPGNERRIRRWNNSIGEETRRRLRAKVFPAGATIFPKIGAAIATNKKRLLTQPSCADNNVMAACPSEQLSIVYLYGLLLMKNLSDFASKSDPPSMRQSEVEGWEVPLPPRDLQDEYAARTATVESIEALAQQAATTAERTSDALMSRLLAG